jgi:hypothetical protein
MGEWLLLLAIIFRGIAEQFLGLHSIFEGQACAVGEC